MKTKSIKKTRVFALVLGLLFVFTTFLGLNLFVAKAEPQSYGILKFKQIESGDGFAIALSYDNELYGWSLTRTNATSFATPVANTKLGEYYPSYPTKIKIDFMEETKGGIFDKSATEDSIKMIATTRNHAALITKAGYIYTWGPVSESWVQESTNLSIQASPTTVMLLRNYSYVGSTNQVYEKPYQQPALVDYLGYYKNADNGGSADPNTNAAGNIALRAVFGIGVEKHSITGNENNFILKYGNSNNYFAWGDDFYRQRSKIEGTVANIGGKSILELINNDTITNSTYAQSGSSTDMYVGNSFVIFRNESGGLFLKGKNFFFTDQEAMDVSGNAIVPMPTSIANPTSLLHEVGVKGNDNSKYTISNGVLHDFNSMNFTQVSRAKSTASFAYSNGTSIDSGEFAKLDSVALGDGYGYAIGVDNKAYMFGNGFNNQSGQGTSQYYDSFTEISGLSNVVQVVAGQQTNMSDMNTRFAMGNRTIVFGATSVSDNTTAAIKISNNKAVGYIDESTTVASTRIGREFISAALTSDNKVYAWNQNTAYTEVDFTSFFGASNVNRYIVALSGGYGNNLFALSNLGDMFRIQFNASNVPVVTALKDLYIQDIDLSGTPLSSITKTAGWNWDAESQKNIINFGVASQSIAKISLDKAVLDSGNSALSTFSNSYDASSGKPLLVSNDVQFKPFISDVSKKSGDAYRMLVSNNQTRYNSHASVATFSDHNLMLQSGTSIGANADIKFRMWGEGSNVPLRDELVAKYIKLETELNNNGTTDNSDDDYFEFKITPLKSTANKFINIEFGIGRYDTSKNLNEKGIAFYEVYRVSFDIFIGNTVAVGDKYSNSVTLNDNRTISSIPLLDTNNRLNNSYSVAVMDVSTGFEMLAKGISDKISASSADNMIKNDLLSAAMAEDAGFPSSTRLSAEAGRYYYGNDYSTYFNNRYKYLATDADGDLVYINSHSIITTALADCFDISYKFVTIRIPMGIYYETTPSNKDLLIDYFNDPLGHEFDNRYGFYNFIGGNLSSGLVFDAENDELVVSYQIATFTAIKSTNSTDYVDTGANELLRKNISSPRTSITGNSLNISFSLREMPIGAKSSLSVTSTPPVMFLNSQGSLSVSKGVSESDIASHKYFGMADGTTNRLKYNSIIGAGSEVPSFYVNVGDTRTIELSNLFVDTTNIYFAYQGVVSGSSDATDPTNPYTRFKSTFNSNIIDINLTNNRVQFKIKQTTSMTFVLEIRRVAFMIGEEFLAFAQNDGSRRDAEVIYMTVSIKVNNDATFSLNTPDLIVKNTETILLDDIVSVQGSINKSDITLVGSPYSSNSEVLSVVYDDRNIVLTGKKSGLAFVTISASLFGSANTIPTTFKVIVESLSVMPSTLNIADAENIYLDDLRRFLKTSNMYNYTSSDAVNFDSLILDTSDDDEGFYFEEQVGNAWVEVDSIDFVRNATMKSENSEYLRLELDYITTTNIRPTRVIVKFREREAAIPKTFQVAVPFSALNKILFVKGENDQFLVDENGKPIPLLIDVVYGKTPVDNSRFTSLLSLKNDKSITVPVSYLVNIINDNAGSSKEEASTTQISYVQSSLDGYTKYFRLANEPKNFSITPLYPTSELENDFIMVTVAVVNSNGSSYLLNFNIRVSGIVIELDRQEYLLIFGIAAASAFVFLFLIFMIRMSFYWKRKSVQKRIIKKNQMLIKMRDKIHNKSGSSSKQSIVKTRLKMEDPKYAKMFTELRREKESETGITLENSDIAKKAENKTKTIEKNKKKKGKGGKKTIEEMRAEVEAKRMAFAQMQTNGIPPSGMDMGDMGGMQEDYSSGLSREDVENQIKAKLAEDDYVSYSPIDIDNGDM